jgi:spermidine synthase
MGSKRPIILAIFVLSGAAALIDEIVWSRQLVLVFGNTTQAVSAILAGFFGGIAVGSFVGGPVADRVRVPLRMYAFLGWSGHVVRYATSFRLINGLYRDIYPSIEGSPQVLAVLRVGLAVLALAPATVLMGATLPTLTRQFARDVTLAGAFSRLYAANTIGAIVGTLVAGYVLIELLGLSGALAVGAGCSAVAGVAALYLARGAMAEAAERGAAEPSVARPPEPASPAAQPARPPSRVPALALGVAFISGLTSLGYQVTWTRLLASGTGNTTYVFTTILATFLLGLAIGAVLFATLRTRLGDPIRLLAASQLGAAILAILGLVFVLVAPQQPTPNQPLDTLVALLGSSLLVVLPVTICLGVAFPASSALLPDEVAHAGEGSGALLAVNTLGAIAGSLLVPFVLIPLIGTPRRRPGRSNAAVAIVWGAGPWPAAAATAQPGNAPSTWTGDWPAGSSRCFGRVWRPHRRITPAPRRRAPRNRSVGGTASPRPRRDRVGAGRQVSSTPELG